MENILISQQSAILSIYQAGELVSSEKLYDSQSFITFGVGDCLSKSWIFLPSPGHF